MSTPAAQGQSAEHPFPVRSVAIRVAGWIEKLGSVWVEGQIAQMTVRPNTKTVFITLRDPAAEMSLPLTGESTPLIKALVASAGDEAQRAQAAAQLKNLTSMLETLASVRWELFDTAASRPDPTLGAALEAARQILRDPETVQHLITLRAHEEAIFRHIIAHTTTSPAPQPAAPPLTPAQPPVQPPTTPVQSPATPAPKSTGSTRSPSSQSMSTTPPPTPQTSTWAFSGFTS